MCNKCSYANNLGYKFCVARWEAENDDYEIASDTENQYLIDELKPYLGLTGDEAAAAIKNNNLVLNPEQTSKVNRLSKKYYTNWIVDQYESTGKKFNKLSPEQQTVIMSVGYQYGNLKTRTPKFWKGVINDDWDSVVNELRDFKDDYGTRRNTEADLLSISLENE